MVTKYSIQDNANFRYDSADGLFFQFNPNTGATSNLRHCRVEFAQYGFEIGRPNFSELFLGFYIMKDKIQKNLDNFKQFLSDFEKKMKVEKSVFYETNLETVFLIKVSPFWLEYNTRSSIFTLFLRFYLGYDGKKGSYHLMDNCNKALQYFLDGHTVPLNDDLAVDNYWGHNGFVYKYLNEPRNGWTRFDYKTNLVKV